MRFRFIRFKWSNDLSEAITAAVSKNERVVSMSSDTDGIYLLVERHEAAAMGQPNLERLEKRIVELEQIVNGLIKNVQMIDRRTGSDRLGPSPRLGN